MRKIFAIAIHVTLHIPAYADRDAWVTVESLNRGTCPASTCGTVGVKMLREKKSIYEEKMGVFELQNIMMQPVRMASASM